MDKIFFEIIETIMYISIGILNGILIYFFLEKARNNKNEYNKLINKIRKE